MNFIRIVEWFRAAPYDGKTGIGGGRGSSVGKFHLIAVNSVTEKLGIHTSHSSLDVELAHKPRLGDELGNVINLDFDALVSARRYQNFLALNNGDAGAESRSTSDARAYALHSVHQHVIAAVFSRVVRTSVTIYAPVAGEGRRNTFGARIVGVTVKESEVRGHKLGTIFLTHPKLSREMV